MVKTLGKNSNKTADKCYVSGCSNDNSLVGGHVKKVDSNDNKWYIIPLCRSCNAKEDEIFTLNSDYKLVRAIELSNCGS
jgi:hypothetical protein